MTQVLSFVVFVEDMTGVSFIPAAWYQRSWITILQSAPLHSSTIGMIIFVLGDIYADRGHFESRSRQSIFSQWDEGSRTSTPNVQLQHTVGTFLHGMSQNVSDLWNWPGSVTLHKVQIGNLFVVSLVLKAFWCISFHYLAYRRIFTGHSNLRGRRKWFWYESFTLHLCSNTVVIGHA